MAKRIALLGGGLHNQLLALRLLAERPDWKIELWESSAELAAAKMISCHQSDVPETWRPLLEPFWLMRWDRYRVCFPEREQTVPLPYQTLNLPALSKSLIDVSRENPDRLKLLVNSPFHESAAILKAQGFDLIIDTRPTLQSSPQIAGVQQFLGRVYKLAKPHGLTEPIIMDARVPQKNGFCFVYTLPLSEVELLIEDTRLLAQPESEDEFERGLSQYIQEHFPGAIEAPVVHEERGKIPIPLNAFQDFVGQPRSDGLPPGVLLLGAHHGFFHPTTGYSLPLALRSIEIILAHTGRTFSEDSIALKQTQFDSTAWKQHWSAALLFNRFLLWGFDARDAHNAFSYFYELPLWFITRFYRMDFRWNDLHVILTRLPPKKFRLFRFVRKFLSFFRQRRTNDQSIVKV